MVGSGRSRGKEAENSLRTRAALLARFSLASILFLLGYLGTSSSLANVVAKVDPQRAHALSPGNGVIMAKYAQDAFTASLDSGEDSLSARLALQALLTDPTAAEALNVLGLQSNLRGDTADADRIFAYSIALSRRELQPRIWAIEQAVSQGDIAGALRNYDLALRTARSAPEDLYPTLIAALAEPRIRHELLKILSSQPAWAESFVTAASNSAIEPEGTVALFIEGQARGIKTTNSMRVSLVNSLFAADKPKKAWDYYRTIRRDASREKSRDPKFRLQVDKRAVFDWRTGEDTGLSVAILRQGKDGLLDFSVPPSKSGVLVRQTQMLPQGTYVIEGRSEGIDQPERSRPFWSLTCAGGRELGRVPVQNSNKTGGRFSGRIIVPEGCFPQTLSLVARSSDKLSGLSGRILEAKLMPARNP